MRPKVLRHKYHLLRLCFYLSDMVLDQHEASGTVGEDARKRIREALLKQHHHQNHKKLANRIPIVRSFADIGKKQSEPHSMDKNGEKSHKHLLSQC